MLLVTRLDDDPLHPQHGSLRWALKHKGPRVVNFVVGGDVVLQDRIVVKEPCLSLDGSTAPGGGICIRGGSLEFKGTHDVLVRHLRIRLGDRTTLRKVREAGLKRPEGSSGLDCVSLTGCRRVLFDHCSLSWSCDELFGITRCRDVTIQWCILSEPLGNPRLHPYGDNHAFCINASASTLSIHHCLFARYVMRGPQFECNDMRAEDDYTVRMEAVNNVIFDYRHSGSRCSTGVEKGSGTGRGKRFEFQLLNNLYVPGSTSPEPIEMITKHGRNAHVRLIQQGNAVLHASGGRPDHPRLHPLSHKGPLPPVRMKPTDRRDLATRLPMATPMDGTGSTPFEAPVPVTRHSAQDACLRVLDQAGDTGRSDPVDKRILRDVSALRFRQPLHHAPGG